MLYAQPFILSIAIRYIIRWKREKENDKSPKANTQKNLKKQMGT
jgi:hypothetical protein